MNTIKAIVTHLNPHLDEVLAIWMLWHWGQLKYPGVEHAHAQYWTGGKSPDGRTAEEWEADGFLLVGIGGGRFDEHRNGQASPECAATLVAKDLGIDTDPALAKILAFVHRIDTRGGAQPMDLFSLTKLMFQHTDPEEAFFWATKALEAKYAEQLEEQEAKADMAKAEIHDLMVEGHPCRVAILKTDNKSAVFLARAPEDKGGLAASVVVAQRSSGHVQVFCDKQNWNIEDVVRLLRVGERMAKGLQETLDPDTLAQEGKVPGVEEWHYVREGQMLLNGSLNHTDVPVTQLAFEDEIVPTVILGMRYDYLPHEHCRETGQCLGSSCPFFQFGLDRCQALSQLALTLDNLEVV